MTLQNAMFMFMQGGPLQKCKILLY